MDKLELFTLEKKYSVCKLQASEKIPDLKGNFFSITKTSDEISIIIEEGSEPVGAEVEKGWKALKVMGVLDFSLTGVLNQLTDPLAQAKISIFALSTYDTDYLLVKESSLSQVCQVLEHAGIKIK